MCFTVPNVVLNVTESMMMWFKLLIVISYLDFSQKSWTLRDH